MLQTLFQNVHKIESEIVCMKIYNAGPLFTEGEVRQRKYEGQLVRDLLKSKGISTEGFFNPIEAPFNDKANASPTSEDIYTGDTDRIMDADVIFFDISNEDSGTMVELGLALAKCELSNVVKPPKVYVVSSDIRFAGNIDQGHRAQIGHNQYVIGGVLKHGITIHNSFESLLEEFAETL